MAKKMMDIGLDANGDLLIVNGDFVSVESTEEHQKSIILDGPGEYPFAPLATVGVWSYIDDEGPQKLTQAIAAKFTQDGMEVNSISVQAGVINVDAYYP